MKQESRAELIRRGQAVQSLLNDEAVKEVLADFKEANYKLFVKATTADERVMAQARAQVLATIETALNGIVESGKGASELQERADKREKLEKSTPGH